MYFITTLRVCGNIVDDCRTIGMSSSYGDSYRQVLNNALDMFECGYYQYAVISYIAEGYYPDVVEQQWFKYFEDQVITDTRPVEIGDYKLYIIG